MRTCLLFLAAAVMGTGCGREFKVGDCFDMPREKWEQPKISKVIEIGRHKYRTIGFWGDQGYLFEWEWLSSTKVECPPDLK